MSLNPQREIRCTCEQRALLGIYGVDERGLYVHIKIHKSQKLYGEMWVRGNKAQAEIRCRSCRRIFKITIQEFPAIQVERIPELAAVSPVPMVADRA